jgi:DNA invertase Pin-like site-specific DNA recombinase
MEFQVAIPGEAGRMMFGILAQIKDSERVMSNERIKATMDNMKKGGQIFGQARFGYKLIAKKQVPVPAEQKILAEIGEILNIDPSISLHRLIEELYARGITKLRRGDKIWPSSLDKIIRNDKVLSAKRFAGIVKPEEPKTEDAKSETTISLQVTSPK